MKRYTLVALIVLCAAAAAVPAQPLRGSYFFENSLLRGKLNPAFAPQHDFYISVPVAGYAGFETLSNVGLDNFLFPDGDKTYNFLNDRVAADTFFGKLPEDDPYLSIRFETDILGGGYRLSDKLYLTSALSVAGYGQAGIPLDLLHFAKTGRSGSDRAWSLEGPHTSLLSFASLSAGASYDLGEWVPGLRAGGRLHLMTGLKAFNGNVHRLDIRMEDALFAASTAAAVTLSGFSYDSADGFRSDGFSLHGFGFSFDLGVEYRIRFDGFVNGLNLSASVGNLGLLSFGKAPQYVAEGSASFEGFQDLGREFDLQAALDQLSADFGSLAELGFHQDIPLKYGLHPDICAGVEAPFLDEMLSAGLLYTNSLDKHQLTVSFNATPLEWLNLNAHYTFGPVGRLGFYAEYIPKKYVGVFFGFEKASFKTNRNLLGIKNFTQSATLGLNILLGIR